MIYILVLVFNLNEINYIYELLMRIKKPKELSTHYQYNQAAGLFFNSFILFWSPIILYLTTYFYFLADYILPYFYVFFFN